MDEEYIEVYGDDDFDKFNDIDQWPEYECDCGYIDYYCDICGYHGHECPLDDLEEGA